VATRYGAGTYARKILRMQFCAHSRSSIYSAAVTIRKRHLTEREAASGRGWNQSRIEGRILSSAASAARV
jgi:hypothetical protein